MLLAAAPSAEAIRRKAAEVVSRPDYQLEQGLDEGTQSLLLTFLLWILKPFVWLFEAMEGLPIGLRVLFIILLSVIAIALIAHIVWTLVSAIRQTPGREPRTLADRDQPADPAELESAARAAETAGEHLEAVRLLFRAALLRIEAAEKKKLRVGITNRELLRRYRTSALGDPLQLFVETIDRKWYGGEVCEQSDFDECRQGYLEIQSLTNRLAREGTDAERA